MFSEPAQPYTILDEMFFISSITVYQQAVLAGTNLLFLLRVLPALCKNACWELPKPFPNCIRRMQAARSGGTLPFPYKQKNTPKVDFASAFGVFRLPAQIPVPLRCLFCEESLDIFLCPQKLLHFLLGLAVFRVSCFLPLEQLGILGF